MTAVAVTSEDQRDEETDRYQSGHILSSVLSLKFDEEMGPACGAGGSIKPGVERSETPGGVEQTTVAREGGRQTIVFQVIGIIATAYRITDPFLGAHAPGFMLATCSAGWFHFFNEL